MRRWTLVLAALAVATPLSAQDHSHHHAGHGAPAAGAMPAGWEARLDRANASMSNVRFMAHGDGIHVVLGPSGIFYNPAHRAQGRYTARATFVQSEPTQHPEGYGLLVGGQNLNGPAQEYVYFLVRQDGRFLIKHRKGAQTHTIQDWTEHPAIARVANGTAATNALAVEAAPNRTRFTVNGQEVASFDNLSQLNASGIVGLRINHNLDLHVSGFGIDQAGR